MSIDGIFFNVLTMLALSRLINHHQKFSLEQKKKQKRNRKVTFKGFFESNNEGKGKKKNLLSLFQHWQEFNFRQNSSTRPVDHGVGEGDGWKKPFEMLRNTNSNCVLEGLLVCGGCEWAKEGKKFIFFHTFVVLCVSFRSGGETTSTTMRWRSEGFFLLFGCG